MLTPAQLKQLQSSSASSTPQDVKTKNAQYLANRRQKLKQTQDAEEYKQTPEGQNFLQKMGSQLGDRFKNIGSVTKDVFQGKINPLSGSLQSVGQLAGGVGDVLATGITETAKTTGKVLSSLTPDAIEKPVVEGVKQAGQSLLEQPVIKSGLAALSQGMDGYNQWKEQNPEAAGNLEATLNIASLFPIEKAAGVAFKGVGQEVRKVAGAGVNALEESLDTQKKSFIQKLIEPVDSKKVRESQVPRTTETGKGLFQKSVVQPTFQEKAMADSLAKVQTISPQKSFQQNYNAIKDAVVTEAKSLEQSLVDNNFLVPKKEVMAKLKQAANSLSEMPTIVGDAEKTAQKLLAGAQRFINENSGDAKGLLNARKQYDAWVKSQKPKVFDANIDNAFTIANREVRDTINNLLESKATNVAVKDSLRHQSNLYSAMDSILPKAASEANTKIGRIVQGVGNIIGVKNKAVQTLATAAGIGGLGAAATFAPAAAVGIGAGLLMVSAGKLILRPQVKQGLINVLKVIEKAGTDADPIRSEIKSLLNSFDEKLEKLPGSELDLSMKDRDGFATIGLPKGKGATTPKTALGGQTYYHATTIENADSIKKSGFSGKVGELSKASHGDMQKGVFLYDDVKPAETFGKNFERVGKKPTVIETNIQGKVYDANTQVKYGWEDDLQTQEIASNPKIIAQLKKDGYVGVTSTELGTNATFVFEPSAIKIKSKLPTPKLTGLEQEARKYKSADDFVKAQPTVYHGSTADLSGGIKLSDTKGLRGENQLPGIYVTDNLSFARDFSKKNGVQISEPVEGIISGKILTVKNLPELKNKYNITDLNKLSEKLKAEGYDAVKFTQDIGGATEMVVLNKNALKTKSQLTDIWNKANLTGLPELNRDDVNYLLDFMDSVRLKEYMSPKVEASVKKIAEGFDIDTTLSNAQIANKLTPILDEYIAKIKSGEMLMPDGWNRNKVK